MTKPSRKISAANAERYPEFSTLFENAFVSGANWRTAADHIHISRSSVSQRALVDRHFALSRQGRLVGSLAPPKLYRSTDGRR